MGGCNSVRIYGIYKHVYKASSREGIKMRDFHRYIGKDLWIPVILVLFAYCIAGGVHGEKIHKSTVRSLLE